MGHSALGTWEVISMPERVIYQQINKDHAYWTEKRRVGQIKGGHTAGLLTHIQDATIVTNVLFDAGLGTIEGLCDLEEFSWEWPLTVFITHGHIDHHAELMILAELWCKRQEGERRGPLEVYCTGTVDEDNLKGTATLKRLRRVHSYGFGSGKTLTHVSITSGGSVECGIFKIRAIDVDHFDGAVIYIVEFGQQQQHKIVIGWDMKMLPPVTPILKKPSLALLEANTWTPLSAKTGHTSVEELVCTRFIQDLDATVAFTTDHYGIYLVHYGGGEDPDGILDDTKLEAKFQQTYPTLAGIVRVAKRGQRWSFRV